MATRSTEETEQRRRSQAMQFDGIASFLGSGSLLAWRATCVAAAKVINMMIHEQNSAYESDTSGARCSRNEYTKPAFGATEADWHRRQAKRREAVHFIKSTAEYVELHAWWCQSTAVAMPRTPNPYDRSLNKRCWEARVMEWRLQLKHRHAHFRWQFGTQPR